MIYKLNASSINYALNYMFKENSMYGEKLEIQ